MLTALTACVRFETEGLPTDAGIAARSVDARTNGGEDGTGEGGQRTNAADDLAECFAFRASPCSGGATCVDFETAPDLQGWQPTTPGPTVRTPNGGMSRAMAIDLQTPATDQGYRRDLALPAVGPWSACLAYDLFIVEMPSGLSALPRFLLAKNQSSDTYRLGPLYDHENFYLGQRPANGELDIGQTLRIASPAGTWHRVALFVRSAPPGGAEISMRIDNAKLVQRSKDPTMAGWSKLTVLMGSFFTGSRVQYFVDNVVTVLRGQ